MSLKLYNTMSRSEEEFKPLSADEVTLYTCGHTVYGDPHIGNWRAYITWDILRRTLRANGYSVNHVQNITDVGHLTDDEDSGEDKLQKTAEKERKTAWEVAEFYTARTEQAREKLGIIKPTHSPKATEYMAQQIELVKKLEAKGVTYEIKDDGIYFDTSTLKDYGKLARLDIEGLKSGARVKNVGKRNITDFALWKFTPKGVKRDMEWDSPWGKGFPGWHLECSVMANELLGDQIDIHTGGVDHIPIHHTNEIAQTETITGKTFVNYWLHNKHMMIDGTKMSKSLGNIYTIDDLLEKKYDLRAFRLLILTSHYRTESNFTWKLMNAAQSRLKRWQAMADLRRQTTNDGQSLKTTLEKSMAGVDEALNDDLNTPTALKSLEESFNSLEKQGLNHEDSKVFDEFLKFIDNRLGINLLLPDIPAKAKEIIKQREQARAKKDFAKSDELRDELLEQGVRINDSQSHTTWSRA